jgi:hypothetical protein
MANSEPFVKISISASPSDMRRLQGLTEGFQRLGLRVRRGTVLRALLEIPGEREMVLRTLLAEDSALIDPDPVTEGVEEYPTVDVPPRLLEKLDRVVAELARQGCRKKRAGVIRLLLSSAAPADRWEWAMRRCLKEHPRKKRKDALR